MKREHMWERLNSFAERSEVVEDGVCTGHRYASVSGELQHIIAGKERVLLADPINRMALGKEECIELRAALLDWTVIWQDILAVWTQRSGPTSGSLWVMVPGEKEPRRSNAEEVEGLSKKHQLGHKYRLSPEFVLRVERTGASVLHLLTKSVRFTYKDIPPINEAIREILNHA